METDQGQSMQDGMGPIVELGPTLLETMEIALNFSGGTSAEEVSTSSQTVIESSFQGGTPVPTSDLPLDDTAQSDSERPESPPVQIQCIHAIFGCKSVFKNYLQRTKHTKSCIYSILRWCQDPKCMASGAGKFNNLSELITHAIKHHGCVQMKNLGGQVILPLQIPKNFLDHRAREFNVKLMGTYELETNGKTFRTLFMFLAKDKMITLISVLFQNSGSQSEDYIRLTVGLMDSMDNGIPITGALAHPSHSLDHGRNAVVNVVGIPIRVFESIKKKLCPRFMKSDIIGLSDQSGIIKLKFKFNAEPLRCNLMTQNVTPLVPYLLTWEEAGLDEGVANALFGENSHWKLSEIGGLLLPQLMDNADLLIEGNELKQILSSCLAAVVNFKNGKVKKGRMGRFYKAVILFPNLTLLRAQETFLKSKAEAIGLTVASVIGIVDKDLLESIDESDVIVSTPNDLLLGDNSTIMLDKIKFMVLVNTDYLMKEQDTIENLKKCLAIVPKRTKQKLLQVGLCQDVNQRLLTSLQESFFKETFKTISIGPALYDVLDMLQVSRLFTPSFNIIVNSVFDIIGGFDPITSPNGGWLVLANDQGDEYEELLNAIDAKLNNLPINNQWRICRCDQSDTNESVPVIFECFQQDSEGMVLLSSYFALNFAQLKQCGGIIIIKEAEAAFGNLEMQNLLSFSIDKDGNKKPVFCLFD